jgi:hypothetical protein
VSAIDVIGELPDGAMIIIHGRDLIRAVHDAARRTAIPVDCRDLDALERASAQNHDIVGLEAVREPWEAEQVAAMLDEVHNGDDLAPRDAAAMLRRLNHKRQVCPCCEGEGEVDEA